MKEEAIAMWRKLEEKHDREKKAMAALMQFAVDISTPEQIFDQLKQGLEAIDGPQPQETPYVGEGVQFDRGAKPFIQ
jgi:hypothetical protein